MLSCLHTYTYPLPMYVVFYTQVTFSSMQSLPRINVTVQYEYYTTIYSYPNACLQIVVQVVQKRFSHHHQIMSLSSSSSTRLLLLFPLTLYYTQIQYRQTQSYVLYRIYHEAGAFRIILRENHTDGACWSGSCIVFAQQPQSSKHSTPAPHGSHCRKEDNVLE